MGGRAEGQMTEDRLLHFFHQISTCPRFGTFAQRRSVNPNMVLDFPQPPQTKAIIISDGIHVEISHWNLWTGKWGTGRDGRKYFIWHYLRKDVIILKSFVSGDLGSFSFSRGKRTMTRRSCWTTTVVVFFYSFSCLSIYLSICLSVSWTAYTPLCGSFIQIIFWLYILNVWLTYPIDRLSSHTSDPCTSSNTTSE